MRKSALWQLSRVPVSLLALLGVMAGLAFAGCGGGGGSSNPSTGTGTGTGTGTTTTPPAGQAPNRAFVMGQIIDDSNNPVSGATVTVVNAGIASQTASDGRFTLLNVPLTATQVVVTSPSNGRYVNYVRIGAAQYSQTKPCPIPLPALSPNTGASYAIPFVLPLISSGPPAPPDQISACPK